MAIVSPKPPLVVGRVVPAVGGSSVATSLKAIKPPISTGTLLRRNVNASTAAQPATSAIRSKIELFDAASLTQGYFRFVLYAETSRRKTSTAAQFSDPELTRIVLLRRKEQMLPLRDLGYKQIAYCPTLETAQEALLHPEALWPDWAKLDDRYLMLDDLSQLKDMLLEDNETRVDSFGNEREVRDARQVHKGAKDAMQDIVRSVLNKPMHFGCVAMAASFPSPIDGNERIWPDLPPKMGNMIDTDFEFVLYIDDHFKLVTTEIEIPFRYMDPKTNKEATKMRRIFAKNKLPLQYCGVEPGSKPLLNIREPLDLRAFWDKVKTTEA